MSDENGQGSIQGGIRIVFTEKTDVGRRRELNEDSYKSSEREGFCVVADGMGGRDFGEVASSLAVSELNTQVKKYLPESFRRSRVADDPEGRALVIDLFDVWIRDITRAVFGFGEESKYTEMGTTIAFFCHLVNGFAVYGHVGDSRVYRIRDGVIDLLTEDHSFVNAQLRSNLITAEQAARSRQKNIITRAIGTRPDVKPDIETTTVRPGDRYLLCSDGLSDLVEDLEILELVRGTASDEAAVGALVDAANDRGGKDNITVVLARVVVDDGTGRPAGP